MSARSVPFGCFGDGFGGYELVILDRMFDGIPPRMIYPCFEGYHNDSRPSAQVVDAQ